MALPIGQWLRFSLLGAQTTDTWSINVWMRIVATGVPTSAQLATDTTNMINDFVSKFWNGPTVPYKSQAGAYTTLTGARGLYYVNNVIQQSATVAVAGGAGTGSTAHPPQSAMCFTLLTGLAGRRNRGRIYLPFTGGPISTTTGQATVTLSTLATNLAAWLTNRNFWITASPFSGIDPIVMTQTGSTPSSVTSVRVDSILDSQRGRRSRFAASGVASAPV